MPTPGGQVIEVRNGSDLVLKHQTWGLVYIDELVQIVQNGDAVGDGEMAPADPDYDPHVYYALHNANYNVMMLLADDDAGGGGTDGLIQERYEYTPYGQRTGYYSPGDNDPDGYVPTQQSRRSRRVWNSGTSSYDTVTFLSPINEVGHQGLMHDEVIDLIQNRARELHPRLGRFMQRDPMGYTSGASLHNYASSSPVLRIDPAGLRDCYCGSTGCAGLPVFNAILDRRVNLQIRSVMASIPKGNPTAFRHALWDVIAKDSPGSGRAPMTNIEAWLHSYAGNMIREGKGLAPGIQAADCMLLSCGGRSYCVGTDKIGHFFQQGHMLYEIASTKGDSYAEAFSWFTEGRLDRVGATIQGWDDEFKWLRKERFALNTTPNGTFYGFTEDKLVEYDNQWGGGVGVVGEPDIAQRSVADLQANSDGMNWWKSAVADIAINRVPQFRACDYVNRNWVE